MRGTLTVLREEHPGPEILRRFLDGGLRAAANRRVVSHLLSGCEECRRFAAGEWPARVSVTESGRAADPDWVVGRLRRLEESLEREKARAALRFSELQRHPPERQVLLVRNSTGFQSLALGDRVLWEACEALFENPRRALQLADLGREIARGLSEETYGKPLLADFRARAWTCLGNARRVLSDLHGAERALAAAGEALAQGSGEPTEEARILESWVDLRGEQRRFDEAFSLIDRVLALHRRAGDQHRWARSLSTKAGLLDASGRPRVALRTLRRAIRFLDPGRDPRTVLVAKHALVHLLHEIGRIDEALERLAELRDLEAAAGNRIDHLRLLRLEGRLARSRGRLEEAERAYGRVRDGFVELELPFEVARVSLDLARVYLERGKLSEIRQLAAETLALFRALGVHREAQAAAALFEQAARAERLSLARLVNLATSFERIRAQAPSEAPAGRR